MEHCNAGHTILFAFFYLVGLYYLREFLYDKRPHLSKDTILLITHVSTLTCMALCFCFQVLRINCAIREAYIIIYAIDSIYLFFGGKSNANAAFVCFTVVILLFISSLKLI